jgi:hypothetical protein
MQVLPIIMDYVKSWNYKHGILVLKSTKHFNLYHVINCHFLNVSQGNIPSVPRSQRAGGRRLIAA